MFNYTVPGDEVWSIVDGWGEVIEEDKYNGILSELQKFYPIRVKFGEDVDRFKTNGKSYSKDKYQTLYWDEIKFEVPKAKKMFKDAEPGDKLWSIIDGWGEVIEGNQYNFTGYPIKVKFGKLVRCFTNDGKSYYEDKNTTLFWDEIKFTIPKRPNRRSHQ